MNKQDQKIKEDKPADTIQADVGTGETTDWKEKYLRALADYQNIVRRTDEEKQYIRTYAAESIVRKLLPVLDTLELSQKHVQNDGLALALKEFYALLESEGVHKIDVYEQEFDPHTMECIQVVEGKENVVVDVVRAGYMLQDRIIRPAQVKVGKKI